MSSHEQGIARIERLAERTARRIRLGRALTFGGQALCAALGVAILDLALRKVGVVRETTARCVLGGAGIAVIAASVVGWAWTLPRWAGARALDRYHGWHDRLANALAFASLSAAERTPLMHAAIDDATEVAGGARPEQAMPVRLPRSFGAAAALGAVLCAVAAFEVRTHVPAAHARTIDPLDMSADDLDDVKDFLKQAADKDQSDDTKAAIEEFNKLVDDIASKRLDRTEAFRRMEALEEKLTNGTAADHKALEQELAAIGDEMKKAELTRPAGAALADNQLEKARDALREAAKKARGDSGPVDKAKLDEMREALKKAAERAEKNQSLLAERRQQLADDILKMKEKMADGGSDEEQSLLQKKQRELERLDRDLDGQRSAGRQLDRLDRELEQAAEDLMKDLGASAQDLEQGAEDINHLQEQQMSQQEKEELRQKLQELRQLLRQQGSGGKSQTVRLQRFSRMARGQGGAGGQSSQGGDGSQPGQSSQSQQGGGQGQGQGADGQGAGNGQNGGQNGGQGGGETWIVGPNGEKILMLSKGSGGSSGGGGDSSGQGGEGSPGHWGEGHDPHLQGKATNPKMGTQDTEVQGADSAQGGSRSQAIQGAAERGFASRNYRKVYTEYHQVAEESLAKDDIPGGYRFYVKRYFQLIRPREAP
jgi:hypothetical protein